MGPIAQCARRSIEIVEARDAGRTGRSGRTGLALDASRPSGILRADRADVAVRSLRADSTGGALSTDRADVALRSLRARLPGAPSAPRAPFAPPAERDQGFWSLFRFSVTVRAGFSVAVSFTLYVYLLASLGLIALNLMPCPR